MSMFLAIQFKLIILEEEIVDLTQFCGTKWIILLIKKKIVKIDITEVNFRSIWD